MLQKTERGQALILIALAAIGLFAFAALAVDGTRNFSNKRHAQNAADTSVLAAALASIRCDTGTSTPCTDTQKFAAAELAARARATSNGYTHDTSTIGPNTKVYVSLCNNTAPLNACEGIVSGHESEYIRVRIVDTIPTTFGRVIGRQTLTTAAEAIARVQGSTSTSTGSYFSGAAMVSTNNSDSDICFRMNGGGYVYTHNSGISINCSYDRTVMLMSNSELHMDAHGQVVGCWNDTTGNKSDTTAVHNQIDCHQPSTTSKTYSAADFVNVPTMPATPTCNGTAYRSGNKIYPGSTGAGNADGVVPIDSNVEFTPGTYCLSHDLNTNGGVTSVTGTGTVTFVMSGNAGINMQSGNYTFDNLIVYSPKGAFRIGGGALTVNGKLRFYSSSTADFTVLSGASVTAHNTYMYLKDGNISWESGANLSMKAPPQSDPDGVGGLLVYKPWGNTSRITFNGGSNVDLYGTFLAPQSPITLNGQTGFTLHSQIIGWDYIINGGAVANIWYDASQNYSPPAAADPTIELTK